MRYIGYGKSSIQRLAKTTFCFLLSALMVGQPLMASQLDWSLPAESAEPRLAERKYPTSTSAPDYDAILKQARAFQESIRAPRYDLEELLVSLDFDPLLAFEYVRDQIKTEPYEGSLRNPPQVLSAGAGNTQDKSRLLAYLTDNMGFPSNVVRLSTEKTESLAISEYMCEPFTPDSLRLAPIAGLGPADLQQILSRSQIDYAKLKKVLPASFGKERASAAVSAESSHYVAHVETDSGWMSFDTALPENKIETADRAAGVVIDEPEKAHQVRFSLLLEELVDEELTTRSVLETTANASDLTNRQIGLFFSPASTKTVSDGVISQLSQITGGEKKVFGVLNIDGKLIESELIDLPVATVGGGLLSQGQGSRNSLTGILLEITSLPAAGKPQTEVRRVLDLVPDKVRADYIGGKQIVTPDLLETIEYDGHLPPQLQSIRHLIVSNGGLSPQLAADNLAQAAEKLPLYLSDIEKGRIDLNSVLYSMWSQLHAIGVFSESLTRSRSGSCVYVDRARVYLMGMGKGDQVDTSTQWFDWTLDNIAVAEGSANVVENAANLRLWHGVIQSALETNIMLNRLPPDAIGVSTSSIIAEDMKFIGNKELAVFEANRDRENNYLLIGSDSASTSQVPVWWRVNESSGATDARVAFYGNSSYGYGIRALYGIGGRLASGYETLISAPVAARNEYTLLLKMVIFSSASIFLIMRSIAYVIDAMHYVNSPPQDRYGNRPE